MKVIWSGIEQTFRTLTFQTGQISEKNMRLNLTAMLMLLKQATPKDTGFASSRWTITGAFPRFRVENDAGYIEYLNAGSSKKAPPFFIERIALRFGIPLGMIVETVPSSLGSNQP